MVRRVAILLFVLCILLGGCNKQEDVKNADTEMVYYDMKYYELLPSSMFCSPIIMNEEIHYLYSDGETSIIGKMNLLNGEKKERELDFAERHNIVAFTVDEEANSYFIVSEEVASQIWNLFLVKESEEGELIYKEQYSKEQLELVPQLVTSEKKLFIKTKQQVFEIGDDGKQISVKEKDEEEDKEIVSYQGAVYRVEENGENRKLFNLLDYDIEHEYLDGMVEFDNGILAGWNIDNIYEGTQVYVFVPKEGGSSEEKFEGLELILAVIGVNSGVKEAVVDFNKSQKDIRILLKEYDRDGKSLEEAMVLLNADIVGGNAPDIIALLPAENHDDWVEKGLLENLQPYVDASEAICENDYVEAAWEIGKADDFLFAIPTEFGVQTIAAKSSVVGEECGMDLDRLRRIYEQNREMALISDECKINVFSLCAMYQAAEYIDYEAKKADFEVADFYKLLEFADSFAVEPTNTEKEVIFQSCDVFTVDSFLQMYEELGTKDVTFIGYPTTDGTPGIKINQGNAMYGICSQSKYKEECWKFIESYIAKRNEKQEGVFFSARKDILEKQFRVEFEQHGEELKGLEFEGVWDDFQKMCGGNADNTNWDDVTAGILWEELTAYFEGDKDVRKVTDIIQNRVQLYLTEQE